MEYTWFLSYYHNNYITTIIIIIIITILEVGPHFSNVLSFSTINFFPDSAGTSDHHDDEGDDNHHDDDDAPFFAY